MRRTPYEGPDDQAEKLPRRKPGRSTGQISQFNPGELSDDANGAFIGCPAESWPDWTDRARYTTTRRP